MALPHLKHPGYTVEDWKTWEGRWELINGMAYDMTPAPNPTHQRISRKLVVAIDQASEEARRETGDGACEVFHAPLDVFLGQDVLQPDLVVVCDPAKVTNRGIEGAPELVVEILSPSTASRDVTRKRWAYEAAGVSEYLIVDPEEQVGLLFRLDAEGRYQEVGRIEWGSLVGLLGDRIHISLGS